MPKQQTLSLSAFHGSVPTTVEDRADDALPSGPSAKAPGDAPTRKYIAEWDGRAELLPVDVGEREPSAKPAHTESEFKEAIDLCLREFLAAGDLAEACRCVLELSSPEYHFHVIKRGVILAMDKADREREMVAILFSTLHARQVLTSKQVARGFEALAESLDDLAIDCPDAASLLAHFLADAVLDGLLRTAALKEWPAALRESAASLLAAVDVRLSGRQPIGGSQLEARALVPSLGSAIEEYLCSHDAAEVARRLDELQVPPDRQHLIVRVGIEKGMERKDYDRELISQLLSRLFGTHLRRVEVARGFELLLSRVDDITVDNPHAPHLLAAFLVRAVFDDLLPPAFVRHPPAEALSTAEHRDALTQARALLDATHFSGHRAKVWGPAADVSLPDLKAAVTELAREYFVSCELSEAVRCVRELQAPRFHHEVVKRLLVVAIDGGAERVQLAEQLVLRLCAEAVVPPQQLSLGCQRLVDAAADLALDNPQAPTMLADFVERFCDLGHLAPPVPATPHGPGPPLPSAAAAAPSPALSLPQEEWRAAVASLRGQS